MIQSHTKVITAFSVFMIALLATVTGVNHGLDASSHQEAKISHGQDYNLSDDPDSESRLNTTIDPFPIVPNSWQPKPVKPYSPSNAQFAPFFEGIIDTFVRVAMGWASIVSIFVFHNQWWIKEWWIVPLFNAISFASLVVLAAFVVHQYRTEIQRVVS